MLPVALTIAGSDPSGGAGIQADLKTFHQFGVYGEAVITLITVQNTRAVSRVEVLPAGLVIEQIQAVVSDIPPAAAKTGALGDVAIVEAVAGVARSFTFPLIVDPVMISKHGARLLSPDAEEALKRELLPRAFLVMPNIPEAESLTGMTIRTEEDMREAAERLVDLGCKAALVKGGHANRRAGGYSLGFGLHREVPRETNQHTAYPWDGLYVLGRNYGRLSVGPEPARIHRIRESVHSIRD